VNEDATPCLSLACFLSVLIHMYAHILFLNTYRLHRMDQRRRFHFEDSLKRRKIEKVWEKIAGSCDNKMLTSDKASFLEDYYRSGNLL